MLSLLGYCQSESRATKISPCNSGASQRLVGERLPEIDERGSGTALVMVMVLFSWVAFLVVTITGSWIWQAHLAAQTADLAALSGAHALVAGESACISAQHIADANGAKLAECNVKTNDAGEFLVKIKVSVPTHPKVPALFEEVSVQAQAGMLGTD